MRCAGTSFGFRAACFLVFRFDVVSVKNGLVGVDDKVDGDVFDLFEVDGDLVC
tara:strand:+ start:263 stop:421 length:159 start_codon:yes stop_codon:yes gene_type:complete